MKIIISENQLKNLSTLLNKTTIPGHLNEDVTLAISTLKKYNIPLDDSEYLNIKNKLIKNNNIGYLGSIVKLAFEGGYDLEEVYDFIIEKKDLIKSLPQQLSTYTNLNDLKDDLNLLQKNILIKKLINKLSNKYIKQVLLDTEIKNTDLLYFIA